MKGAVFKHPDLHLAGTPADWKVGMLVNEIDMVFICTQYNRASPNCYTETSFACTGACIFVVQLREALQVMLILMFNRTLVRILLLRDS